MDQPSDRSIRGPNSPINRRSMLTGALAVGLGAGVAACSREAAAPAGAPAPATSPAVAFRGARQAGIVTEPQPYAAWVGLNLTKGVGLADCRRLMKVLTDDIDRLMAARAPLTDLEPELASVPAHLTVTVGVGPGFLTAAGRADRNPAWLAPLPAFSIDRLKDEWGQTDLILQICADSPTTVAHAQRRLIVGADPLVTVAWVQRGFRDPMTGGSTGQPFRNLFGQVDGTVQPDVEGTQAGLLWLGSNSIAHSTANSTANSTATGTQAPPTGSAPAAASAPSGPSGLADGWAGGTSMVVRRIAMDMEGWDRTDRMARENSVGRRLADGAPVTGGGPDAKPDVTKTDALGFTIIDPVSHMRRAMPVQPHEVIFRRPYSYDDAPADGERSNTGLVFVSFQADPVRQYVPIQQRLAEADLLNLWTTPIGSAVYAVLPGAREGEHLAQVLLS